MNRLSNLFLLCLCSCCQLAILADSFGCRMDASVWPWLLALCVLLWICGAFRRGLWIGMPLSAGLLYLAYRRFGGSPAAQLRDLIDRISGAYYTHITNAGAEYPYAESAPTHTLVLLLLGFFLAAYLITALQSRSLRISLSLLETLPIFTACVLVNGNMPPLPCLGMLLFWFLLLAGGNAFQPGGSGYRTVLYCLLPLILLLGWILQSHRPEDYAFSDYERQLNERFELYTNYFDLLSGQNRREEFNVTDPEQRPDPQAPRTSFQNSWDAADRSMDLSAPYDESFSELRVLQVKAETSGRLYLRTRSYGDYTGTGWAAAEDLSSVSSLPFAAFAAENSSYTLPREIEVRTFLDLDGLCVPYFAPVSSGSDVLVTREDQTRYRIQYFDYRGSIYTLQLPEESEAAESLYRAHAHSVYTRLPEKTRLAALSICGEAGLRETDPDIVLAVANYVQQSGTYDLLTSAYPSEDYAIYFLTEAHRGYCIHYASAAAVLYRALGIPARVTEGFVAQTEAGSFRPVTAADAHSWVEVYLDGVGWVPVEVTARGGFANLDAEPSPSPVPMGAPDETDTPTAGDENASLEAPGDEGEGDGPGEEGDGLGTGDEEAGGLSPWLLLLILPVLAVLLALWYVVARARFLGMLRRADGRKAVLACWRYAGLAASFGGEIPAEIVQAAEKAAFSPHQISQEELELCRSRLDALIEDLYPGLSPLKRFHFRLLLGMK